MSYINNSKSLLWRACQALGYLGTPIILGQLLSVVSSQKSGQLVVLSKFTASFIFVFFSGAIFLFSRYRVRRSRYSAKYTDRHVDKHEPPTYKDDTQALKEKELYPPKFASVLLCLFLLKADRDNIIGDMDEQFPKWVKRHGLRTAQFLYCKDTCTAIYPTILKLIAKIVSITGVGEIVRRFHFW